MEEEEEPGTFGQSVAGLHPELGLKILGGCCGTDDRHICSLAAQLATGVQGGTNQWVENGKKFGSCCRSGTDVDGIAGFHAQGMALGSAPAIKTTPPPRNCQLRRHRYRHSVCDNIAYFCS